MDISVWVFLEKWYGFYTFNLKLYQNHSSQWLTSSNLYPVKYCQFLIISKVFLPFFDYLMPIIVVAHEGTGYVTTKQNMNPKLRLQSTLAISNSDISNSAILEASNWIKNTFWLLFPTIIWRRILFYKSKLPEVQINLHFG